MSFSSRPIRSGEESSFSLKKIVGYAIVAGTTILYAFQRVRAHVAQRAITSEKNESQSRPRLPHSLIRQAATACVALCAIALLLLGGMRAMALVNILSPFGLASIATAELKHDGRGYTNILLLGIGDKTHPGADLTDTIQIASIDPKTKSVMMLSLPRDLYMMKTENMGIGRINGLFHNYRTEMEAEGKNEKEASQRAMEELAKEIGNLIHLDIQYTALLNFSGFEQAVDAIGGVDVTVPEDITDYEYPARDDNGFDPFIISAGPHHLDGPTALKYARSRHSSSDFSRSARQQQIISAVMQKIKQTGFIRNIGNISKLFQIVSANFESTMSLPEIMSLARSDTSHIVSMQVSDNTGAAGGFLYPPPRDQFEGASVLLPISNTNSLKTSFDPLKSFGELIFSKREWYLFPPRISILNAGAKSGSAHLLEADLVQYGFDVVYTGNYSDNPKQKLDKSFLTFQRDALPGDAAAKQKQVVRESVAKFLSTALGMKDPKVAASGQLKESPEIVIVTGKDFAYKPFHDLLDSTLTSSSSSQSAQ